MAIAYLIFDPADREFVDTVLLPPLPALSFDRALTADPSSSTAAMEECGVILAVLSAEAVTSESFTNACLAALQPRTPVVPVVRTPAFPPELAGLRKVVAIDAADAEAIEDGKQAVWYGMAELLPSFATDPTGADPAGTVALDWHEHAFSTLLRAAVGRQDYNRCAALVTALERYAKGPESPDVMRRDLDKLRAKRQFLLMRRYAEAMIDRGANDFRVRRQHGQALIELKDLDRAIAVLGPLIEETTRARHTERFEASGLLGRAYKQQYIDAGGGHEVGDRLIRAIDTYRAAFVDSKDGWHGINAASCILRADRDGIDDAPPVDEARDLARGIREALDRQEHLPVWDSATRVEAYLDLDDLDEAAICLDDYLAHPGIQAFEAASTYRQFDEVLQLGRTDGGRKILKRLGDAAERLRAGSPIEHGPGDDPVYLLISVADASWEPTGDLDLEVRARLGTILSVSGTQESIDALLKDPRVLTVERSRPAGYVECARSVPFVEVAATYHGSDGGSFSEDGSAALVAVIDADIDVLHEAFLDEAGRSRIVGIWDQRDDTGPPPPVPDCAFGTYHSAEDIVRYVVDRAVPEALRRPGSGHGTHVASIATGRRSLPFAGGVAPAARLLVVISGGDQPTGYSDAHVAALAFIDHTADELGMPVVVNLSQGMNAGQHDGLSRVEAMFDEFTTDGLRPGRIVVKSAGNEQSEGGHAKITVPRDAADDLLWECDRGKGRQVIVELWWDAANEYRFQLRTGPDQESAWVHKTKNHDQGRFTGHGNYDLTLQQFRIDGNSRLRISFDTGVSPLVATRWTLAIEAERVVVDDGILHAWIERDGTSPPTRFTNRLSEEMTLSVPGTAKSVITVGAIDARRPLKVGGFSSFGPTRDGRKKPEISAPGVGVQAARRDSVNGVTSLSGTSMAAPHVAGAIALLLSRAARTGVPHPSANMARSMLVSSATVVGPWDRGRGFGVLNVTGLLETL